VATLLIRRRRRMKEEDRRVGPAVVRVMLQGVKWCRVKEAGERETGGGGRNASWRR
jgi:hypothetical protein